jgi:hypothetical protein
LFYFDNEDVSDKTNIGFFNGGSSGLLAPTWLDNVTNDYYKYNSAWAYLKNNYEEERADALKEFIILLSQISSESPWYFQEVTGVDEALVRENWMIGDERKKISIKCLNDPIDHRIESLLSLYRSIVWSHSRKCEVLPANLRKFDMGLFVFSGAINGITYTATKNNQDSSKDKIMRGGTGLEYNWKDIGDDGTRDINYKDKAAYKYIEFHNCEISMDSLKSGFSTITNELGFEQEFTIDIYFDDCYEDEFNPYIMKFFGDFFVWDLWSNRGRSEGGDVEGDVPVFNGITTTNVDESSTSPEYENEVSNDVKDNANGVKNVSINELNNDIDGIKNPPTTAITGNLGNTLSSGINSIKNSLITAITGGLGNIFGNGVGIAGALDATEQELNKQIRTLQNKVIGNINNSAIKASRSATSAVTAPILGTIKAGGTMVSDAVDVVQNVAVKPVLGSLKAAETASERITEMGTQAVENAGQKTVNESKKIGNIAYDSQVQAAGQIGKNRLKAKLGKL